jgi:heme-degrading monooxygenase HmoA
VHYVLWEYEVHPDGAPAFERLYGPEGAWAELFRTLQGYLGTELLRDAGRPTRYVSIDRWTSSIAYEAQIARVRAAYERLDAEAASLTVRERRVGTFDRIPDRE